MVNEKVSWAMYAMNMLFFVYFAVLYGERLQSFIRSVRDADVRLYGSAFNGFVYTVSAVSMIAAAVLLAGCNRDFFAGLFGRSAEVYSRINYAQLSIAAGVLLFSGMVHTEHTIPVVQFVSYGALIVAMALRIVDAHGGDNTFMRWFSFAYLTAFSMAIPVMYHSQIKAASAFHIIEAIVMAALVISFTFMMRQLFMGKGADLFYIAPIAIAVIGDAAVIIMRWKEKVNTFVLIFIAAAVLLYCAGKILSRNMLNQA